MGIKAEHLREYVIRPTLKRLGLWSQSAENLLMGTVAQESKMGYYLHQLRGPAVGIFQIEPATHDDVWEHYLDYREELGDKISELTYLPTSDSLIHNLAYSTAIARIVYLRAPEALPVAEDLPGLARYWKKYYNTQAGRGTERQFINSYEEYVR